MNFQGREIDAAGLWSQWVDFPQNTDFSQEFSPLLVCPNPAHDSVRPHFQLNFREPLCHCFSRCGISGTWVHAICVIEQLYEKFRVEEAGDERERAHRIHRARRAARKLILRESPRISREAHVQKKRPTDKRAAKPISADALRYELYLPPLALEYLDERGIDSASIAKWQLGWDADERRIVIPARDENAHLKFLVKRSVRPQDQPKYLYTEGFPKTSIVFGVDKIELGMIKSAGMNLVEGTLDTIWMHQQGWTNTGAILGTGISDQQVRIIARINPPYIVLCFDKDLAGVRNIEIAYNKLRKYPLFVMRYPKGKSDPMELSGKEVALQIARAVPALDFIYKNGLNVNRRKEDRFATH